MPQIAGAAGLVEAFKIPIREVRERFTLSDIVIAAWRSREISANMNKQFAKTKIEQDSTGSNTASSEVKPIHISEDGDAWKLPEGINNGVAIPKKFFDEKGDLNLSRVSGKEAAAYINALGIRLPVVMR